MPEKLIELKDWSRRNNLSIDDLIENTNETWGNYSKGSRRTKRKIRKMYRLTNVTVSESRIDLSQGE